MEGNECRREDWREICVITVSDTCFTISITFPGVSMNV